MANSHSLPENILITPSFLKDIFTEFSIDSCILQLLKSIVSVPSDLHDFWWEILCDSNCFPLRGKAFLSCNLFICPLFSEVWVWWILAWISLHVYSLGFVHLLEVIGLCLLGVFQPLFFWILFQVYLFLLSFPNFDDTDVQLLHFLVLKIPFSSFLYILFFWWDVSYFCLIILKNLFIFNWRIIALKCCWFLPYINMNQP